MPKIPNAVAPPDLMPWVRWAQEEIASLRQDMERQALADANTNASQNSTMNMLIDRLGTVQDIMDTIGSSLTFDASQVISGEFETARIPDLSAAKLTSGTVSRPVNTTGSVTAGGNVGAGGNVTASGDVAAAGFGTFNSAWNYDVSAVTRRAVWMDSTGKLGYTPSTKRFKKDIAKWSPEEQAVLAIELVRFHWKKSIGSDEHWEYGVIAEQLHDLGLEWLVSYDDDGETPVSVHYDRIALALLPLVQNLAAARDATNARLDELIARVSALEESN